MKRLTRWLHAQYKTPEDRLFLFFFTTILIVGFLTRVLFLTTFPPGLDQDEAANGYDAYVLGLTGKDHYGNSWPILLRTYDDWVPVLLTYLTVPVVKFLGLSVWSVRLVPAVLGFATLPLLYLLCRQLQLSRWASALAVALLAISGWHIFLSHFAIPPSIVPFFQFLFLVTVFRWISLNTKTVLRTQLLWGFLVGLTASLLTHSYSTMNLLVPVFLCMIGISILLFRRHLLLSFATMCATYAVIAGPMLWITIMESETYNARFNDITILSGPKPLRVFLRHYQQYFSQTFFFGERLVNPHHRVPGFGLYPDILAVPLVAGLVKVLLLLKKCVVHLPKKRSLTNQQLVFALMVIWILLGPTAPSLTKDPYHLLRAVHLPALLLPCIALGCTEIYQLIDRRFNRQFALAMIGLILLVPTVVFLAYMKTATSRYPRYAYKYFNTGVDQGLHTLITDPRCTTKRFATQITQPYIYYLFYSKVQPNSELYDQVKQKQIVWDKKARTPEKVGDIVFQDISKEDTADMQRINHDPVGKYSVYLREKDGSCILLREY